MMKKLKGNEINEKEEYTIKRGFKNDKLVYCIYCNRDFNEISAKKHIPFCKNRSRIIKLHGKYKN